MNINELALLIVEDGTELGANINLKLSGGNNQTLKVTFSDELGTCKYVVTDTKTFVKEVEQEMIQHNLLAPDSFWYILNTKYKID